MLLKIKSKIISKLNEMGILSSLIFIEKKSNYVEYIKRIENIYKKCYKAHKKGTLKGTVWNLNDTGALTRGKKLDTKFLKLLNFFLNKINEKLYQSKYSWYFDDLLNYLVDLVDFCLILQKGLNFGTKNR